MSDTMRDDTDTAQGRAEERRAFREAGKPLPPVEPDVGKLPLLPREPRRPWRRTLRQRLMESG
jgi:hypothetical protein